MRPPVRIAATVSFGLLVTVAATVVAQRSGTPPGKPSDATARIVAAAQALLTTLDDAGRAKVQFPFEGPQKTKWSNLPSPMYQREGLRLADLTPAQRAAVNTLLSAALSGGGLQKVTDIMRGDEVLKTKRRRARRGRRPRGRRRHLRRRRVLPRLRRNAVGDNAVDAAVWRSPPGDQSDDGREPGDHGAEPPGHSAGNLHRRRPDRPSARQRERQIVRADQCVERGPAQAGDPRLARRRSRARARSGRTNHSARRHSRVSAHAGAADDAARYRAGVGGHPERRVRRTANGGNPDESPGDLLRLERSDRQLAASRTSVSRAQHW